MQDMNDGGDEGQEGIGEDQGEDISGMQPVDGQGDQEDGEGQGEIDQDGGNEMDEGQLDFEQIDMKICGDLSKSNLNLILFANFLFSLKLKRKTSSMSSSCSRTWTGKSK